MTNKLNKLIYILIGIVLGLALVAYIPSGYELRGGQMETFKSAERVPSTTPMPTKLAGSWIEACRERYSINDFIFIVLIPVVVGFSLFIVANKFLI